MKKILVLSLLGVICFMPAQLGAAAQVSSKECIEGYISCWGHQTSMGADQCYRKCDNKQGTTLIVKCKSGTVPAELDLRWTTQDIRALYHKCVPAGSGGAPAKANKAAKKNSGATVTCRNSYVQCTGHDNALKCAEIKINTACVIGVVTCKDGYKATGSLGKITGIGTVYTACIKDVPADWSSAPVKETTTPVKKNTVSSSNPGKTTTTVKKTTSSSSNSVKTTTTTTGTCATSVTRNAYMDEYLWVDSAGYEFCATGGLRPANEANKKCYDCNNPGTTSKIKGCEVKNPGDKIWLSFGGAVGGSTTQGADAFVFECTNENHGDRQTSHKWKAKKVVVTCPDVGTNKKNSDITQYDKEKNTEKTVELFYNSDQDVYCQKLPEEKNLYSVTMTGDNSQVVISEQNASRLKIKRAWTRLNAMSNDFKVSVWRDKQGNFNTARLASDSIAAVVLGTTGALVTSNIVKKNQVSGGFEDISCQVGGQTVAGWGDQFSVGIQ